MRPEQIPDRWMPPFCNDGDLAPATTRILIQVAPGPPGNPRSPERRLRRVEITDRSRGQ